MTKLMFGLAVWFVPLLFLLSLNAGAMRQDKKMMMKTASPEAKGGITCPVTGALVDPAHAAGKTAYKGKTYYFCCPGCIGEFKKNPEKFLKERKTKAGGKMKMKPMKHSEMKH